MKIKVVIVILAVASIALAIALFATRKQAEDRHVNDVTSITEFSNQVVEANEHLKAASQTNLTLFNDLAASQQQLARSQEQMTQLSNGLAAADSTLAETRTSLASAQELVTNLNLRVADLEAQNKVLDQRAEQLSNTLAQLTAQIEDTKNQLAVSETNAAFLRGELQKQLARKAELEHEFNDVDALRSQVNKLKEEMFIARRRQFMNSGVGLKKGGELLIMHNLPVPSSSPPAAPASNYDLNVEIGSDGSVRVVPPPGRTNNAAH